ncbi:uncharacterized protein MYCGRDRAFT_92640 [Zymoseptoria tritici IPO323]|uniref:Secreted protein n=1 Tax=Zymoseptoria tritici (strain CBS 115943 / IPO323) TaxID=336722 RepID=F9X920_ZYMTI|nr:uncharacterized protein MYCGRDRAFT_92640 [Zymoseptoria tritici IPO323]EGP88016.1 hypothetical protein MYCGRDRAFT_92640 [Zymoseptoria tritici IPO323]
MQIFKLSIILFMTSAAMAEFICEVMSEEHPEGRCIGRKGDRGIYDCGSTQTPGWASTEQTAVKGERARKSRRSPSFGCPISGDSAISNDGMKVEDSDGRQSTGTVRERLDADNPMLMTGR